MSHHETNRHVAPSIVIPVYNSEHTLGPLVDRVIECLIPRYTSLQVVLVNDGSQDDSDRIAREAQSRYPNIVTYVCLARNFGEHNAVMCGLRHATGDCAAIIDDDFQNPPEEIIKLIDALDEGHDVVYSYYAQKHHSWFRNLGSRFNDRVATWLLRKPAGLYLSSFKALDRFAIDAVLDYTGPFPYIDGLILRATDAIGTRLVVHHERATGRSNYTLIRLVRLWLNMATSFSIAPLRFATLLGFFTSAIGLAMAVLFVAARTIGRGLISEEIPAGWASLIVSVVLFSGVQLIVVGVVGEYVGRIFLTNNRQPQYVIRSVVDDESKPRR